MCSLCCTATETSDHLFFSCPFSIAIKNWLQDDLSCSIDHTSFESMINICSRGWSKQIEDIVLASVLNMIWAIWRCRNQVHFHDKRVHLASAINSTIAAISLTKNISSVSMTSSVAELLNLKRFLVAGHPHQASMIKQVTLIPPIANWVKCNINGAVKGAPGQLACSGTFRDYRASILGCFAANLGISYSSHAELIGAMWAIEIAFEKGWKNLWLKCDSNLVVAAFKSGIGVPLRVRNSWTNCIALTKGIKFIVSHIYREGNTCADRLASHGLTIQSSFWQDSIPDFVREDFSVIGLVFCRIGLGDFYLMGLIPPPPQ